MKSIYTIIFLFLLTIPNFAFSLDKLNNNMTNIEPGAYILAGAGISRISDSSLLSNKKNNSHKINFSPAPVFNVQFGYRINRFCRVDFNTQYRKATIKSFETIKSLKLRNHIASVNGYLDFNNASRITPYVTAGVGFTVIHVKQSKDTAAGTKTPSSHGPSLNLGAGIQIQMTNDFGIDIGYKYSDLGKLKIKLNNVTTKSGLGAHEFLINLLIIL